MTQAARLGQGKVSTGAFSQRAKEDLKFAFRLFQKSPGFTCLVIGVLALGLGATAAMYTVVDRVLLRPLPYDSPKDLVEIQEAGKNGPGDSGAPFLDLQQWRKRTHLLSEIAYYSANQKILSFLHRNTSEVRVVNASISGNLLKTLGVQPAFGRGFEEDMDLGSVRPEDSKTIILSDAVWRTVYGADKAILGRQVVLDGQSYTAIGVMPPSFTFPFQEANSVVWTPLLIGAADTIRNADGNPSYFIIARKRADTLVATVEAELRGIQSEVSKQYLDPNDRDQVYSVSLRSYGETLVASDLRKSLIALLGASGVLWLISCVNVTGLMLARSAAKQRETALRIALGANRWQIIQQLLIEGLVLSLVASTLGFALAVAVLKAFQHGLAAQYNVQTRLMPNFSVVATLLGLTLLTALLSSVWPALGAANASVESVLRQGSTQGGVGRLQLRGRSWLIVVEIALSLPLLVGCGLLLNTLYSLRHVPLGFRTESVVAVQMSIPAYKFAGRNINADLYQPLLERVQHLSGVQSAALMTEVPLGRSFHMIFPVEVRGSNSSSNARRINSQFRAVSPDMRKVFDIKMFKGRFFDSSDTPSSMPVVVVNRAFVRQYTGSDEHPEKILGEPLLNFANGRKGVVIGILEDQRQVSVSETSMPEMEISISQITPDSPFSKGMLDVAMNLAVRTDRSASLIIPELREIMSNASPELANSHFFTMQEILEDSYGSQQLVAGLLEIFGGIAIVLCMSGIYGLLAYLVNQRTRDVGVRLALGAQRIDVMGLILKEAAWMLVAGSILGLFLAYLTSLLFKVLLYGVQPHDPLTMVIVTLAVICGGLASAYFPARRAANIDPVRALRAD